ncbi:MAG: Co2+/Mg2+ efflux protein ApaG [Deltaproteobacteria bacterium]|nr:Co2+/Mg2+ efflux protein ApaG [Deltaproteobacteria bacterium]
MSQAVTEGIRVVVRTHYLEERSAPAASQYAFAYTIRISNEGKQTAQLVTRHWLITNAEGQVQEVKGDGVVGVQPVLTPGESFEYTSGCVLATPQGTMQGTYQMVREDGTRFDAEIAPFLLAVPNSLN